MPADFRDHQDKPDITPVANINRREYFADSHLPALIDAGVAYNHDLQIADLSNSNNSILQRS